MTDDAAPVVKGHEQPPDYIACASCAYEQGHARPREGMLRSVGLPVIVWPDTPCIRHELWVVGEQRAYRAGIPFQGFMKQRKRRER